MLWSSTRIFWGSQDSQGEKEEQIAVEPAPKKGAHGRGDGGGRVKRRDPIRFRWWVPVTEEMERCQAGPSVSVRLSGCPWGREAK